MCFNPQKSEKNLHKFYRFLALIRNENKKRNNFVNSFKLYYIFSFNRNVKVKKLFSIIPINFPGNKNLQPKQ
jgi:hypothetical protein